MVVGKNSSSMHRAKIVKCLDVLLVICRLFGFEGKSPMKETINHWTVLAEEDGVGWMKVVKYKLSAYFAFHLAPDPLPPKPFKGKDHPGALFSGRLGRWAQLMLKRSSRDWRYEFLASIKQSKKGMPRDTSRATLRHQEELAITKLTTEPETRQKEYTTLAPWSEWGEYPEKVELTLNEETWKYQIRRTVKELFEGHPLTTEQRVSAFFPSTSANYIMNRKNAGAIGAILEHPSLMTDLRVKGGYLHKNKTKLRGEDEEEIENEQWLKEGLQFTPGYDAAFSKLWIRILSAAAQEEPNAEPVALPEPLKYRVITKGPPFIQTTLRALWKHMHTITKGHPAFSLIGQPVDEIYISDRLGNQLGESQKYLSGDYADATNGLYSWASDEAADEIGSQVKLYPVEKRLLKSSLTGHILRGKQQKRGQLMGSITSFVILCIINAAACRWASEVDQKRIFTLKDAPIMINGDDCAIKCTEVGRHAWQLITQFVGLEESVGKTYFSKDFIEINSTQFRREQEDPQTLILEKTERIRNPVKYDGAPKMITQTRMVKRLIPFRMTRYVNVGLMFGLKRSGLSVGLNDQDDPRQNLGTRYRELLRLCPSQMKEQAHKAFINHHRNLLVATRLPWFVPEWIGGVGLIGFKEPSEKDLRIARMITINWAKRRPISLAHQEANWKTWQEASKRVPSPFVVEEKNSGVEIYTRAVASECINLLFDSDVTLERLFQVVTENKTSGAIKHNARLWSPSMYPKLPTAMAVDKLWFKPQYLSYERQRPVPTIPPHLNPTLD
jgi:hypothetical protein